MYPIPCSILKDTIANLAVPLIRGVNLFSVEGECDRGPEVKSPAQGHGASDRLVVHPLESRHASLQAGGSDPGSRERLPVSHSV